MNTAFETLSEIERGEIINLFSVHEANRPIEADSYAHDRITGLIKTQLNIRFSKIKFRERIQDSLMLPYHGHNIDIIPPYGKNISDSLNLFFKKEIEFPNSDCIKKIKSIKDSLFNSSIPEWSSGFLLIGNNIELAHPGDHYCYKDSEQYFIFNGFHRLMAYFLSIRELGQFRPITAYYAEVI